jgi:hypothetical protein
MSFERFVDSVIFRAIAMAELETTLEWFGEYAPSESGS